MTTPPSAAARPTALWVVPVSNLAGVARHVIDVARAGLPGWRLIVTAPEGPLLDVLRQTDATVIPLVTGFGVPATVRALRSTIKRFRPQIVHSHLAKADLLATMASTGLPVALVSTEHHISPDRYMFHPHHAEARLMEAAHHARLTRFSRVLAVSASTKADMEARWRTRTPVDVILNGVDRPETAPVREPGLRFLSLTRLSAEKNIDMTLRVFALIAADHPDARLTIAGKGSELPHLQILAGTLGIDTLVDFPGFLDPDRAMASHDVILQPSRSDNCSYTLLDAMAQGMGVAASPIGGNPEILPLTCIASLDDDAGFARIAVEQGLDLQARPVLGPQVPTVAQMASRIVEEYRLALDPQSRTTAPFPVAPLAADSGSPDHLTADEATPDAGPSARPSDGNAPEVSVVIAYYKAAQWLPSQLDALAHQVNPPTFEVIIADNEGSTELPTVIADFRSILDIRIINATDRKGCGAARNRGVDHAHGNLIAFCDADDIVGPQWIRSLTDVLRARDVLATGPLRLDRINSEPQWRAQLSPKPGSDTPIDTPVLQFPFVYLDYLPIAPGGNMAIRRSTFLRLNGFDESFDKGAEDNDFPWRAIENGVGLHVAPDAIVDYRQRASLSGLYRQRRNWAESEVTLWKNSTNLGRPVKGFSMRWTVMQTIGLPWRWATALAGSETDRYMAAAWSGDIIGNLIGQVRLRVIPMITARMHVRHP
ncbi:glycosyltransferase [Acidipropionibacterium jensenii]|uniref:glycosyltransferase n=1 Tax=Acidipropionibacterium jensenii TaxID=1749 RepID=UPI000BC34CD4|nr:glycosyltransferase [Acidipropionibacterium jensenii]